MVIIRIHFSFHVSLRVFAGADGYRYPAGLAATSSAGISRNFSGSSHFAFAGWARASSRREPAEAKGICHHAAPSAGDES